MCSLQTVDDEGVRCLYLAQFFQEINVCCFLCVVEKMSFLNSFSQIGLWNHVTACWCCWLLLISVEAVSGRLPVVVVVVVVIVVVVVSGWTATRPPLWMNWSLSIKIFFCIMWCWCCTFVLGRWYFLPTRVCDLDKNGVCFTNPLFGSWWSWYETLWMLIWICRKKKSLCCMIADVLGSDSMSDFSSFRAGIHSIAESRSGCLPCRIILEIDW